MVFKKKRWFVGDRLGQKKITADLIVEWINVRRALVIKFHFHLQQLLPLVSEAL